MDSSSGSFLPKAPPLEGRLKQTVEANTGRKCMSLPWNKCSFSERLPRDAGKLQSLGLVGDTTPGRSYFSHHIAMPVRHASNGFHFTVQAFLDFDYTDSRLPTWKKTLSIAFVYGEILPWTIHFITVLLRLLIWALHKEQFSFYVPKSSTSRSSFVVKSCPFGWGPALGKAMLFQLLNHLWRFYILTLRVTEALFGLCQCLKKTSWDCSIDLLLGTTVPRIRVYTLFLPDTETMSIYIKENLGRGFIHKFSAGADSVQKKDRSLYLCIIYRHFNKITIKNKYLPPLVIELVELLSWIPHRLHAIQRFNGFANYYCQFIPHSGSPYYRFNLKRVAMARIGLLNLSKAFYNLKTYFPLLLFFTTQTLQERLFWKWTGSGKWTPPLWMVG